MRYRYLFLFSLALLYTVSTSAAVYGTFPYELEQQTDELSTEIRLGVVNTGDQTLQLEFTAPDSQEYNLSASGQQLPPSRIVETPQGEGWKYLGNGRYAEIREFSFQVEISRYRDSNRIDIPLQVTASPADSAEKGATSPVSQVTSHNYTIFLDPRLRPLERETEREKDVQWEGSGDSVPDEWTEEGSVDEPLNSSKDYKPNQTEEFTGERDQRGVNTVTMILALAIIACTGYVIRVI